MGLFTTRNTMTRPTYNALTNTDDDFEMISIDELDQKELCGTGAFSSVFRAHWRRHNMTVAVKKLLILSEQELHVLKTVQNPCIVKILAAVCEAPDFYIVMEYATGGNLFNYLKQQNGIRLSVERFYHWSEQVTEAVRYLSSVNISHRDIKSPNYLIVEGNLKLCDFGTAKVSSEGTTVTSHEKGSCAWMAPEMIRERLASKKSDVYSLGVVIWELFTCAIPHREADNGYQIMYLVAEKGMRPQIPDDCPQSLKNLIKHCWQEDREKRPTPEQIMTVIQSRSLGL